MKKICLSVAVLLYAMHTYAQKTDTFHVFFTMNNATINKKAADDIDKLIFKDLLIHGQKLIVLGYADYVGDSTANQALSEVRAKSVADYLVNTGGMDRKDIKICIGKGRIDHNGLATKDGYQPDRRVEIIKDHPGMNGHPDTVKNDNTLPSGSGIKVNAVYPLNILFNEGTSIVLPASIPRLQALYSFMVRNPAVTIQIEGHICCVGRDLFRDGMDVNDNGPLSVNRARYVCNYLIQKGIAEKRLGYKGFGGSKPLAYPERTESDRQVNRRVEIRILSK